MVPLSDHNRERLKNPETTMAITRRTLLDAMARLGGVGAAYETLVAWDFLRPSPAVAASLSLPPDSGNGKSVAILGAGIAGLCAAYELDRAGYDCKILEPQRHAGGRCLTLRRGDVVREIGSSAQVCAFDDGLWMNAGPGRIPHHHVHFIDYCRRFGVALQPYIFASRANLMHTGAIGNGKTMQARQAFYDLQGHIAELVDQCAAKGALEAPVAVTDLEKLREMLAMFGDLSKPETPGTKRGWSYRNQSGRAGYEVPPGLARERGKPLTPLALEEILRSNLWDDWLLRDADHFWQTSLLEPVGGMDQFVKGFLRQPLARRGAGLDGLIQYGAKATAIELRSDKVEVRYEEGGAERTLEADFCISTIPMPIFRRMRTNLPGVFMSAAANLPIYQAGKVGWQADRFWEANDNIYGGISWTTDLIDQIWYPSEGYLSRTGVLTGAYMRGKPAQKFNAMPIEQRLLVAREQGERLHPGRYAKSVRHGIAIAWEKVEHIEFAWADETDPAFERNALILSEPQGRFHLAGDQITWLSGWQEGCIVSAWETVKSIDRQVRRG
jgi:monoamine oxidase